jgi:hypothetical protein
MVAIGTALGANRRAIHHPCAPRLEQSAALRADEEGWKLALAFSRIPVPSAAFTGAVLAGAAHEGQTACPTFLEGSRPPPFAVGTLTTRIGAESCCITLRPEINPTPLARSWFGRKHRQRGLIDVTCDAGQPRPASALLRWNIALTNPAFGRTPSGEKLLIKLFDVIRKTHTLDLQYGEKTCGVRYSSPIAVRQRFYSAVRGK